MRSLMIALLFSASAAVAGELPISQSQLKFRLMPFGNGGSPQDCTHRIADAAAHDWFVQCFDRVNRRTRLFRVHLWLTRYPHSSAPKESFEVLYWITDYTQRTRLPATGTTSWFHFNEPTSPHSLDLGQSVDNDTAGVYVSIRLR